MLDDYQDLIDELLETPSLVRALFASAGDTPSAKTIAAVSALHERDTIVLDRLQRLVHEQAAVYFAPLPPVDTAIASAPAFTDIPALLDAFGNTRGDLVSLLMNLTIKDWGRTATDDQNGETTLAEEVERHVEFEEAVRARF